MDRFCWEGMVRMVVLSFALFLFGTPAGAGLVETLQRMEVHGFLENFTILRTDTFKEDYHVASSRYRASIQLSGPIRTDITFFGLPITRFEYFVELRPEYESIYDISDRFGNGRKGDGGTRTTSGRGRPPGPANRALLQAFGFNPNFFEEFYHKSNLRVVQPLVPGQFIRRESFENAWFGLDESQNDLRFGMTDARNFDLYYPVREAYIDLFFQDPWGGNNWIRAGKQQIVWGKTDFFRLQDIVNPVDFSDHFFIDLFDDTRIPQWSFLFEHRFGDVGPLRDVAGGIVWVFDRYTPLGFGNGIQPWSIGFGRTLSAFVFNNDLFGEFLFPGENINAALADNRAPAWNLKNSGIGTRWEWTIGNLRFQLTDWFAFQDVPAFGWNKVHILDIPGCNEVLPPEGTFEGGRTLMSSVGVPVRVNVKPKFIRMREAAVVAGAKEKFKHARYLNICGFTGELSARYRKQNTLGLSLDWFEPRTGFVVRIESSWTANALVTDTTKPDLLADSNIIRWAVGLDRPTFFRFLNPTRSFFLSVQAFGTHLPDVPAGRFGNPMGANDNFIFTALAQTQYLRDQLVILVFGAYGTTGQDATLGGNAEWLITNHWSVQLGVTAFLGSRQEHDLSTFANFTGDGRPFSETGFGIGHMQAGGSERNQMDEFWGRIRFRF